MAQISKLHNAVFRDQHNNNKFYLPEVENKQIQTNTGRLPESQQAINSWIIGNLFHNKITDKKMRSGWDKSN